MADTELKKLASTPEKMKIRRRERERDTHTGVREIVCVGERESEREDTKTERRMCV